MLYDSNNDRSPGPPNPGSQSIRYFIDYPSTGWRMLPNARVMNIYNGKVSIPELAGRTVRVATANVEIHENKRIALNELKIMFWKFNHDGLVDQDDKLHRIKEKLDGVAREGGDSIVTNNDIEAVKRCLGIGGG